MSNHDLPGFQDILALLVSLPCGNAPTIEAGDAVSWLSQWMAGQTSIMDMSRGFAVNRCALYWTGTGGGAANDGFDGQAFVDACQTKKGSLTKLAEILDTDLQIFELDPHNPQKPDEASLALACSYGMMAVEEPTQLFCACVFGAGIDSASATAYAALGNHDDLKDFMERHCTPGHAAMLGAAIAGTLKGIPVILEGKAGKLVSAIMEKHSGKTFSNIIVTDDMPALPGISHLPGHTMTSMAVMLKTLHAGSDYKNG